VRVFRDKYGDPTLFTWFIIASMVLTVSIFLPIIAINIAWCEGVETTVTGTVQLHMLKYNKFLGMEYTDMEMRTYSGDTHHVSLLGHVTDLEYGKAYTIHYKVVDYWGHVITANQLLEITPADVEVP
jgi:hypothetical protein